MKKKILAVVLAVVILAVAAVGATLAWLQDTKTITNTFTVGNVKITLEETTGQNYKLIPGTTYAKDPTVGVVAGSEACYLYVELVADGTNADKALTYAIAESEGWTLVEDETNVWCIEVDTATATAGETYQVLAGEDGDDGLGNDKTTGIVTIKDTLTAAEMDQITDAGTPPTLTVKAYAIQKANIADAKTGWAELNS